MKALVYDGIQKVECRNVPDSTIIIFLWAISLLETLL